MQDTKGEAQNYQSRTWPLGASKRSPSPSSWGKVDSHPSSYHSELWTLLSGLV